VYTVTLLSINFKKTLDTLDTIDTPNAHAGSGYPGSKVGLRYPGYSHWRGHAEKSGLALSICQPTGAATPKTGAAIAMNKPKLSVLYVVKLWR
jgi:hypothetical protein